MAYKIKYDTETAKKNWRITHMAGARIVQAKTSLTLRSSNGRAFERIFLHEELTKACVTKYQETFNEGVAWDFATFTFVHTSFEVLCELIVEEN